MDKNSLSPLKEDSLKPLNFHLSSPSTSHNDSFPTRASTPEKVKFKMEKTHQLPCFALNLLEKSGKIQSKTKDNNIYLLKLQKVLIEDNYKTFLNIGKKTFGNFLKQEIGSIPEINFWYQRYYYYSKFDDGILMDYESWYSVTPESIAKYIASLVPGKVIIDGFCGSGGNVIQFSKYGKKVYAIDIEKEKLDICMNNCKVYDCPNNIEFILGDFLSMKGRIRADYVFLSPPWGGLRYKDTDVYSIKKLMKPDISEIIRVSLSVANNIIFYLPRNLDLDELFELLSSIKNEIEPKSGTKLGFDIRILKSNQKIKALLILFGKDVDISLNFEDINEYLTKHYDGVTDENSNLVSNIIKTVGIYNFFKGEFDYKKSISLGTNINFMIKYLMINLLSEEQKNLISNKMLIIKKRCKLELFKNNQLVLPFFPKNLRVREKE